MSSTASSDPVFAGGGRVRALSVRRSPTARRMRLAVDPRDGVVWLTLPRRASLRAAIDWAEGQRAWVEAALDKLPGSRPLGDGATLPWLGATLTIAWHPRAPRTPRIDGDRLHVGGPAELVGARILRWARREAKLLLEAETRAVAARAGVTVGRVTVGDPRTRWGSCSASGDIRYAWRLIFAPPAVRHAIVAHEVAHRLHMHHGPAFHAAAAELLGADPAPALRWLKAHGAGLYWVGRGD